MLLVILTQIPCLCLVIRHAVSDFSHNFMPWIESFGMRSGIYSIIHVLYIFFDMDASIFFLYTCFLFIKQSLMFRWKGWFGHIALVKLPATSDSYYFGHIAAFCEASHPHERSNGHIGWFQASGHPLKGWLRTDNYRICPIAYNKSHNEGWLKAWNQAMSPKPVNWRWLSYWKRAICPKQQLALITLGADVLEVSTSTVPSTTHSWMSPLLLFLISVREAP